MANRLSKETSPYLLQHQDNPVDWYPWGKEALDRARSEDKPILLSIGYSACHWCHVMAHESFENQTIAGLMNTHFINIKVDREERPDLDQIYQNVAQALTRSGGWPLTVFLTPDLKPFFGGTYFPPDQRYGRPSFGTVLEALAKAYQSDRESVTYNAEKLLQFIQELESVSPIEESSGGPSFEVLRKGTESLLQYVDWKNGGLGGAPKFPNPMVFSFLWRAGRIFSGTSRSAEAVLLTLNQMAKGGIYDQLGGGFHRYSVDSAWSVPHFEKMLYDNALLIRLYSEVALTTPEYSFSDVISETVEYVLREMTSPEGGFYSAQDADSEGEEGKYFVWDPKDLEKSLSPEEAQIFALRYGVQEQGNFDHRKTVLFVNRSLQEVANECGLPDDTVAQLLFSARIKLKKVRDQRIAPGLDSKILTSWNGLMISGLIWGAEALRNYGQAELAERAEKAAVRAFHFLSTSVSFGSGRLSSTYQGGQAKGNGFLDDYAFMAMAALDLSRFVDSATYIPFAEQWVDVVLEHFKDATGAGYFFTSDDHEVLIQRPKTVFDQAIPSGSAVILSCLAALSELGTASSQSRYLTELREQCWQLGGLVEKNVTGLGELFNAMLLSLQGPIVVSGHPASGLVMHPNVFLSSAVSEEKKEQWTVCHQGVCSLPHQNSTDAIQEVAAILSKNTA